MNTALGAKWLELLKEIAPERDTSGSPSGSRQSLRDGQFGAIQAVAPSFGVEVNPIDVRDAGEIERAVTAFARSPNGGLIVTGSASATVHRDLIITLAARHRLPAVYTGRFFVAAGGLISYGPDLIDQYRRAAGYVDRILKGEKPADLPVQAPTKYELVINLKTAKALGLDVPPTAARPRRRGDRMMERREFILALGGTAIVSSFLWPLAARGEPKPKMLRVGYVGVQSPDAPLYKAFRNRIAELGYQDGRNFSFEYIQTPDIEGYRPAYRELAAREVDVFLAVGEPGLPPPNNYRRR